MIPLNFIFKIEYGLKNHLSFFFRQASAIGVSDFAFKKKHFLVTDWKYFL
jgi:hypothetical protein